MVHTWETHTGKQKAQVHVQQLAERQFVRPFGKSFQSSARSRRNAEVVRDRGKWSIIGSRGVASRNGGNRAIGRWGCRPVVRGLGWGVRGCRVGASGEGG